VAQAFPDMLLKDGLGNPMGWNAQNPIYQKANMYLASNKNLQNDPEGFVAAVKMAAWDLGVQRNKQLSQKVDRTTAQLRKEQKKQLASMGGSHQTETSENAAKTRLAKLQKEYARTGDRELFVEIVKIKGLNPYM